jgi:hypothetical protein
MFAIHFSIGTRFSEHGINKRLRRLITMISHVVKYQIGSGVYQPILADDSYLRAAQFQSFSFEFELRDNIVRHMAEVANMETSSLDDWNCAEPPEPFEEFVRNSPFEKSLFCLKPANIVGAGSNA